MPSVFEKLSVGLDEESGKSRVGEIVEHRWFEILIMCLVVCDILLVMVEAGVDHHVLCIGGKVVPVSGHHGSASLVGASSTFTRRLRHPQSTLAVLDMMNSHDPHHAEPIHAEPQHHAEPHHGEPHHAEPHHAEPDEVLQCDTREGHRAHHLTHTCHMLSIAILVFFMVEILLKLWVNPEHFMASFVHKLDLVVISISLLIDVVIIPYIESHDVYQEKAKDFEIVAGLLILSRSWRFVRIFHGFFEEYHTIEERTAKEKKGERET